MSTSNLNDDLIGKRLGQFEILDEIGRGGMATVYRARQPSINRIVAVKVLPRHFLHDPDFLERFKREVDVIAHLEHPHILPIYDYGEADGVPFIAMRYLAGGSMAQMLRRGIPSLKTLERPLIQVAQALDHAHRQGIIHRDLKPGNILLDENDNAYLTDFGIARVLNSNLTGSAIIGTPAYMSPEQANGQPLDARSDIYSLGIVLFELLTGREPYEAPTPMALLLKHINEPIPSVRQLRADVPPAVEVVIIKATSKDPDDRYSSAADMALAFQRALQDYMPTDTKETPTLIEIGDEAASKPLKPTPAPKPSSAVRPTREHLEGATVAPTGQPVITRPLEQQRKPPLVWIVAAVLVMAVIAVGTFFALRPLGAATIVLPTPTPFADARIVETAQYAISMPSVWTFTDHSDDRHLVNIWQQERDAFVTLSLVNVGKDDDRNFMDEIVEYDAAYYPENIKAHMTLIDEASAPDGSLRRSYRLDGQTGFPPGQMDVFYMHRAPYLVVIETYSADSTGNDLVPTFQRILDSLRVKNDAA